MRSSLILITLAAGAAAQLTEAPTPLEKCPNDKIPPASVHKSTVAARFRSMAVWVSRRSIQPAWVAFSPRNDLITQTHRLILCTGSTPKNHARYL